MSEADSRISSLEARHESLEDRFNRYEQSSKENLKRIYEKLDALGNRPSWITVTMITILSSGFFSLLTIVLRGHPR